MIQSYARLSGRPQPELLALVERLSAAIRTAMLADGCGEDDHASIIRYFEKLAHTVVSR